MNHYIVTLATLRLLFKLWFIEKDTCTILGMTPCNSGSPNTPWNHLITLHLFHPPSFRLLLSLSPHLHSVGLSRRSLSICEYSSIVARQYILTLNPFISSPPLSFFLPVQYDTLLPYTTVPVLYLAWTPCRIHTLCPAIIRIIWFLSLYSYQLSIRDPNERRVMDRPEKDRKRR